MHTSYNNVSIDINQIFLFSLYRNYEQLVNASDVSIFNHPFLFFRLASHFLNYMKENDENHHACSLSCF